MRKDKIESISIIVPCVGHNTRSNFPYPIELSKINEDMSVIDYAFQHILKSRIKPQVIVIIGSHQFDTAHYLYEKYHSKVDLEFIFQNNYKEITDVIRSAEHLFGDKNILLMPNTIIEYNDKKVSLIDTMIKTLDRQPFVFAYKEETSVTRLKSLGAVTILNGKVTGYEEKPLKHIEQYNAFWTSFAFKKEVAEEVISVIEHSMLKKTNSKKEFKKSVMYRSEAIQVKKCENISTWTNLNAYLLKQYLIKSGIDPELLKFKK